MALLNWLIRMIYCLYAFLLFAMLTLIAFPLVMLSLLFGYHKGGNMIYAICRYWAATWFILIGVKHIVAYEHPHDTSRQWVFVANHISYMDIPPIVLMAPQPIRILGKFESSRIPIFGWSSRMLKVPSGNKKIERPLFNAVFKARKLWARVSGLLLSTMITAAR